MAYALFIVFVLALSAALGLSLFGAFLETKAAKYGIRSRKRTTALITTKVGIAIQSAILLWAIVPSGTVAASPEAAFFLFGTVVALFGLAGLSSTTIKEVAEAEVRDNENAAEDQFRAAEDARVDREVGRMAGEEYRERGEEYRETGERRREEGEKK
jgi:hypothetical protein